MTKPRWNRVALLLLLWAAAGTILSLEFYFNLRVLEVDVTFLEVSFPQYLRVGLWILVAPLILWLGRRFPLSKGHYWAGLPMHLVFSAALMGFYYLLRIAYVISDTGGRWDQYWDAALRNFWGRNIVDVAFYWSLIALGHYYALRREYLRKELTAARLEARLAQAELSMLRGQLHPHFLFNTMNTIAVMVREERNKEAVTLLAKLGTLLRTALDQDRNTEIPLAQELEFLRCYMEIQQARFPDRLTYEVDAGPGTISLSIPNLLIQPLVENAVIHGVSPKEGAGRVRLVTRLEGDKLHIEVSDDGCGYDPEQQKREGIGIGNTRERLRRMYGESSFLVIDSRPGIGTTVRVVIPAHS